MTLQQLNTELLNCCRCPRLVTWREKVAIEKRRAYRDQVYWGRPVPGFGDEHACVFVVGLAPGAHGSNRTGRQFTGDSSGDFLYAALFRAGFASQPGSWARDDGLSLLDLYTAPVCRCAPPDNRPTINEMMNCEPYLKNEIEILQPKVIVPLGRIAFDAVMRVLQPLTNCNDQMPISFSHGAVYCVKTPVLGGQQSGSWIVCSYHPSRQNTQTGRLTPSMFDHVWQTARELLDR